MINKDQISNYKPGATVRHSNKQSTLEGVSNLPHQSKVSRNYRVVHSSNRDHVLSANDQQEGQAASSKMPPNSDTNMMAPSPQFEITRRSLQSYSSMLKQQVTHVKPNRNAHSNQNSKSNLHAPTPAQKNPSETQDQAASAALAAISANRQQTRYH